MGLTTSGGWDANMKFNAAQGGNFGVLSVQLSGGNVTFDNLEFVDGVMNDQDMKTSSSIQF